MDWPGSLWNTDVAAIDGGLQLAILWGIQKTGNKSLPTKIGTYHSYLAGPITGPVHCELHSKSVADDRTVSDILFFNKDGQLAAELCDVEMHMLPKKGDSE